jgi:hypothetical protein
LKTGSAAKCHCERTLRAEVSLLDRSEGISRMRLADSPGASFVAFAIRR